MKKQAFILITTLTVSPLISCNNNKSSFNVTWRNDDESVLRIERNLSKGDHPIYDQEEPISTKIYEGYIADFTGWKDDNGQEYNDKYIVNQDVTFYAQYSYRELEKYTVTWKNGEDVLETDNNVICGTYPHYDGDTPTRPSTSDDKFIFDGWGEESRKPVTKNLTLYAQFTTNAFGKCVYELNEDQKSYSVTGVLDRSAKDIYIKETYHGLPVTCIAKGAFINCINLENIEIPSSITTIEDEAFKNCDSLSNLIIPNSVTTLGANVLMGCNQIVTISLPQLYNRSFAKILGMVPNSLKSITINEGCTEIPDNAFEGCTYVNSITIPDSVVSIGKSVFKNCPSLHILTIPDLFNKTLNNYYFENTACNISSITLSRIESIPDEGFANCRKLVDFNLLNPDLLTNIGKHAFYKCISLKSFFIPKNVSTIGQAVFSYCGMLSKIDVDSENNHFYDVNDTAIIKMDEVNPLQWHLIEGTNNVVFSDKDLNITYIDEYAFEGRTSLTNITIRNTIAHIQSNAFHDCTSLTQIFFAQELNFQSIEIFSNAFSGCSSLSIFYFPANFDVRFVGGSGGVFEGCSSLKTLYLSESSESFPHLRDYFDGKSVPINLKEVYFRDKEDELKINDGMFENCSNIEKIDASQCEKGINITGPRAFINCSSLKSFTFSKYSSKIIPESTFEGCISLESFVFNEGIETIKNKAFYKCNSLKEIKLPKSVKEIETKAFYGCVRLNNIEVDNENEYYKSEGLSIITKKEISQVPANTLIFGCENSVIANDVEYIGQFAFAGCDIRDVSAIPAGLKGINDHAFENCKALKRVNCSALTDPKLTTIGKNVFNGCDSLERLEFNDEETMKKFKEDDNWKAYEKYMCVKEPTI